MKSGAFSLSWEEVQKIARAGIFVTIAISSVVLGVIAKLPAEQTPGWLLAIIPTTTAINMIAYGLWTYVKDNRY